MRERIRFDYIATVSLFLAFIVFTVLVKNVDVRPIGPDGSSVGFAGANRLLFDLFGLNLFWYTLTDWLGVVAILFAYGFAALGLWQLIKRGSFKGVDPDILLLGLFYAAVIGCYVLFEKVVINYRPVLLRGYLEPSYPSSHTMIVSCVMATAMMQFHNRVRNKRLLRVIDLFSVLVIAITLIGRLVSGVHWFTDIAGGALLSAALVLLYHSLVARLCPKAKGAGKTLGGQPKKRSDSGAAKNLL